MRTKARIDRNQPEIVREFRALGCTVHPTHQIGKGFPDIVVGISGVNVLVEIKDGNRPPSERKLTSDEEAWHRKWRGAVVIVSCLVDVHALVKWIRSGGKPGAFVCP